MKDTTILSCTNRLKTKRTTHIWSLNLPVYSIQGSRKSEKNLYFPSLQVNLEFEARGLESMKKLFTASHWEEGHDIIMNLHTGYISTYRIIAFSSFTCIAARGYTFPSKSQYTLDWSQLFTHPHIHTQRNNILYITHESNSFHRRGSNILT